MMQAAVGVCKHFWRIQGFKSPPLKIGIHGHQSVELPSMHIVVLAAFLVAFMLAGPPAVDLVEPQVLDKIMPTGWRAAAATTLYLLGAILLGLLCRRFTLRALGRGGQGDGSSSDRGRRWSAAMTILSRCWLILGLAGVLVSGYARWLMQDLRLELLPLVGKLAAIAPFVVALMGMWILDYPCHRRVRLLLRRQSGSDTPLPAWTLGEYLAYNIRHQLLFIVVPVALMILLIDMLQLYGPPIVPEGPAGEYLLLGAGAAGAIGVFLIAPVIIVRIWRTKPLPDGPLRRGLQQMAQRMGFGFRDIRLWLSEGVIANAAVMGLWGPLRYILISDALLDNMDQESIEAIFAHEAGHVVSHHLPYLAAFAISTAVLCSVAANLLVEAFPSAEWVRGAAGLVLMTAAWAGCFGWISRRFERQSDVIAAWSGACRKDGQIELESTAVFANALQQVAMLNGMPSTQRNWRHGSIAGRVGYLRHLTAAGGTRRQIDRVVRRIKIGLLCALACAAIIAVLAAVEIMKGTKP